MAIEKCLDTYILIEIFLGNIEFVITDLTLAEFYGVLLRDYGEADANLWSEKLERYAVPVEKEILKEAIKFRHKNKKSGISFFDAVGYIFSLKKGLQFVTGDKEFEKFKGVEFRKK